MEQSFNLMSYTAGADGAWFILTCPQFSEIWSDVVCCSPMWSDAVISHTGQKWRTDTRLDENSLFHT